MDPRLPERQDETLAWTQERTFALAPSPKPQETQHGFPRPESVSAKDSCRLNAKPQPGPSLGTRILRARSKELLQTACILQEPKQSEQSFSVCYAYATVL